MKTKIALMALAACLALPLRAQSPEAVRVDSLPVLAAYPAEGVVEAVRSATLAAQTQGRILEMSVDAGDRVRRGDLVIRIDAAQATQAVAGAEAQVEQARANAINARAQFERTRGLFEQKFVSQAALDQAEAGVRAAEAALRAAEAGKGQATVAQGF
ncbi:MAG: biotin/lipoyl-binding protein, partial [Rhodocyclaceae bacterium]|nr:biotin/lipoyl-binding protein [Rhodocyclaceae bacterium]